MAVVVLLRVGGPSVALVVVVMVVAVCIAEMPTTTTVIVGCYCGVVVSILGIACHCSRDWGSVTVLN